MKNEKIKKTAKKNELLRMLRKLADSKKEVQEELKKANEQIDAFVKCVGKDNYNEIMALHDIDARVKGGK